MTSWSVSNELSRISFGHAPFFSVLLPSSANR
jgi:hypothetical protein